ncbi:MAG: ribosome maturation factor RimM [Saprospiraceae bacterium]
MIDTLITIGATQQPHGLKGELKVFIEEQYEDDFFQTDTVFITLAGKKIPYFVENMRGGNALIVKFEDVDSLEAAQKIAKKSLEMRKQDMIAEADREEIEESEFGDLITYTIVDKQLGYIGEVLEILEMPQQEMAVVHYKLKDRLIPLNERLIISVDDKEKIINMDLPEGILEL